MKETQIPVTGRSLWYRNSVLVEEYNYLNGLKHGKERFWDDDGKLLRESSYRYGQKHGPQIYYYKNGQLSGHSTYKFGREDSIWTRHYENGQMKSQGMYHFNSIDMRLELKEHYDTVTVENWETGEIMVNLIGESYFKPKNGIWKYWNEDGKLVKKELYINGELVE